MPLSLALFGLSVSSANASVIYNVDRTIGSGTVTGFMETDGALGVLGASIITDWMLTLSAPNLFGLADVIHKAGTGAVAAHTLVVGYELRASGPRQTGTTYKIG
jgi:hypothetical protein